MYCLIAGDIFGGDKMKVYGPFEEYEDAEEFSQTLPTISWILDLHEPE